MKHVNLFVKVSLILIMCLGFLRFEAHAVRAQDTNPPPAVETTGDSSSSAENSAGDADSGGSSSGGSDAAVADTGSDSADSSDSSDSSTTSEDSANPPDSSTSTADEASEPGESSTAPGDEAAEPGESSTASGDEAAVPGESSTASADDAAVPGESSTSTGDDASEPSDSDASTDDEEAASEGASSEGASSEGASSETAEILDEAAEKDITLADGAGQPIIAADAETEELLSSASSDPWFNAGLGVIVGYTSGGSCAGFVTECHANESNSIQAAINNPLSSGKVIYIEPGGPTAYINEEFTLNDNSRKFNLQGSNVSVNRINLNTNYSLVSVFGGLFSALEVWLNFGDATTLNNATIQQGVTLTRSTGTLNVNNKPNNEPYNESVFVPSTKNGLHIVGHNNPIQNGNGKSGPNGFNVWAKDVTISGFTIQNNYTGINTYINSSVNADNNQFYHNSYGMSISGGSKAVLSNNTFGDASDPSKANDFGVLVYSFAGMPPSGYMLTSSGDRFLGNKYGVNLRDGATGRFIGDEFRRNTDTGLIVEGGTADVTGSTFASNLTGASIDDSVLPGPMGIVFKSAATFLYDNFESNKTGISSSSPADTPVHFSRFYKNDVAINNTNSGAGPIQADNNWWGDNQGADGKTSGDVVASHWLALDMTASDDPIFTGGETSQLTTEMVSTDGVTKTPLSILDPVALAGILGSWFNYTPSVTLQTPGMGSVAGDTFTSGNQAGDALFTGTPFDDEIPTTKVTVIQGPTKPGGPVIPGSPPQPTNPGAPAAPALAPLLPAVIPVTGANMVDLVCGDASQLLLANGNTVVIPSLTPCTMQASAQPETEETLPGSLPIGLQFVDALTVTVVDNGDNTLVTLPQDALMQVNFTATQAQEAGSIAVYWWDGNAWQEVPDSALGLAASNNTGMFVLAMK